MKERKIVQNASEHPKKKEKKGRKGKEKGEKITDKEDKINDRKKRKNGTEHFRGGDRMKRERKKNIIKQFVIGPDTRGTQEEMTGSSGWLGPL